MKKQLLLTPVLLIAINAFSQNNIKPRVAGKINHAENIAQKFISEELSQPSKIKLKINPANISSAGTNTIPQLARPTTTIGWSLLCGSASAYGMLNSNSRPLQYNPNVNAVSFIHRKSASYVETPAVPASAKSGVIVAEISSNWGATWDSTCLWSDATTYGRYPQGAIYSGAGNTNIANAYVVGSGVAVAGLAYVGSWYASKPIGVAGSTVFNSTADATPNAMQLLSTNSPSYSPTQCKHSWSRYGFSSTDDGAVRALGLMEKDDASPPRGVAVVKGTFNGGVFSWTTDSLIPATLIESGGTKVLSGDCQMAWNKAGDVGYVVMLGAINTATLSNKGYQPIIYKTSNSGASWAMVPGINFNAATPEIKQITDHLGSVISGTQTIGVPFFDNWDIVVDSTNNLHIGAILSSGYSSHTDSLSYTSEFTISINPGMNYTWPHSPGFRPFLYDFIGDGTNGWNVKIIDSLSSEDPGASPSNTGFNYNPWDNNGTGGFKLNIDPRIDLGRTPNGNFITFSWTESDTNYIFNSLKYNVLPNIKTRCMKVGSNNSYSVSPTEINVTKPAAGQGPSNINVSSRATLHYMSPTTGSASISSAANSYTVDINTPFTITNSNPFGQISNNTTWYSAAKLSYIFSNAVNVEENAIANFGSALYPNPANKEAILSLDLKQNTEVTINVYDLTGQLIRCVSEIKQQGETKVQIDLNNLSQGIYLVNIKAGSSSCTKKLMVE